MKDPLGYQIAEGFVKLIYWPGRDGYGYASRYFFVKRVNARMDMNGVFVFEGVNYFPDDEFYAKLGTLVATEEEGLKLGEEWTRETGDIRTAFWKDFDMIQQLVA